MKQTKRTLAILLAVLLLALSMPFAAMAEDATSGSCGTDATWNYDAATKTLTISGTGATNGYSTAVDKRAPWFALEADITTVVVEEGITALGNQFLWHNTSDPCAVKTISLPETLTSLGNHSFCNCSELETVNLPKSLVSIGVSVFSGCSSLSTIPYAGTVADWSNVTVDASSGLDVSKVTFHTHAYANPVFDWNSTGEGEATVWSATKATFTCECDATIDIEATVTPVTTNPKCEDAGSTVYTATATPTAETYGEGEEAITIGTFANETYTDSKTVTISATGHTFPLVPHPEVKATCTAPGTEAYWECSACQTLFSDETGNDVIPEPISISKLPHEFVKGEGAVIRHNEGNTHDYKCKNCDTYGEAEDCTIGDWEDGTVTCTESGTEVKKCTICGGICETRDADAKGHVYTGNAINNNDATDESEGTHTMTCKYCGLRSVKKEEHSWNDGEVQTPATCTAAGTKVFTCTISGCGATKEQSIPKTGHDFYDLKIEKEAQEDGTYLVTASAYCKTENIYIEESKTAVLEVDTAPTCKDTGKGHYKTTFTNFFAETNGEYTFEINGGILPVNPEAHNLVKVPAVAPTCQNGGNGGNDAYWRCTICGGLFEDVAGEEGEESTAGEKIDSIPQLAALPHEPKTETQNVVDASCTVAGSYDEVVTCTRCGEVLSNTHKEGEMLPHTLIRNGSSATCTEDGTEAYWTCSVCLKMFSDETGTNEIKSTVTIPKLGHDFSGDIVANNDKTHSYKCKREGRNVLGAVIDGKQTEGGKIVCTFSGDWQDDPEHTATCQVSGIQFKSCDSQCGNKTEQEIDTRDHDYSVPRALGDHSQEGEGEGVHVYYCSYNCGQYKVTQKEAHKWTAWTDLETDPTTCSHLGKITRKCSVCDLNEIKDAAETLPHTYPEEKSYDVVVKKSDEGTTYTVKAFTACSDCHEILRDEADAEVVVTEGKEPTCKATGEGTYVAKFKAPFEDYTILDEDGQPVKAKIAIDPDAHQLTPVAKKEATCEEDGYEAYWQCGLCDKLFKAEAATADDVIEAPIVIGKLNHSYTKKTVNDNTLYAAVTCTQAAKYYYSCARCGAIEGDAAHTFTNGNALGHDFSGAYQNVADGTHNRKCVRCEAYGIGTIENATEACSGGTATCMAAAVCALCNTAYGTVDSTNHNWVENAAEDYLKAAADCTNPAEYYKSCSRCGTTNKEATFTVGSALGHVWGDWEYLNETYHQHFCANDPDNTHREKEKHVVDVKVMREEDSIYPNVKTHCQEVEYCTVCGAVLKVLDEWTETAQHQHEYTSVVTREPNCKYEGVRTFTCQICGNVVTESIATNGVHADADNDGYCDYCKNMMTGGDHCPQCGKIHNGGFGDKLTGFFHRIAAFFTRLFR
ncbi:MAG: leucine-rich repeat domain-containing protein [Clostridia bacterium]|nr:leucine-rich repeat domain-containing protein [Clostridia bacterium]